MAIEPQRPNKVASLSVHRNKRDQRARHEVSDQLRSAVRALTKNKSCVGYMLVAWNKGRGSQVEFCSPDFIYTPMLGDAARTEFLREVGLLDAINAIVMPPPPDDAS